MTNSLSDQTLALAALSQAAYLVQQLARRGRVDDAPLEASLRSLFCRDPETPEAAFGGFEGLLTGYRKLEIQLGGRDSIDPEQARYAAAMLILHKRLAEDPLMVAAVGQGLAKIEATLETADLLAETTLEAIARLYQETLSRLRPRVLVNGEQSYLNQSTVTNRIRALLMAGVRAAFLWRQCGGQQWQLLFRRGAFLNETRRVLHGLSARR